MIEKLYPAFKDNLWGGERLVERYGKVTDMRPCAESWELSMHPAGVSRLADGRLISEALGARELGENVGAFDAFPMLIKFIDARDDLSVQVHPSDEYALKNENSYGKTELWYVVEADEGAGIYLGFKRRVSAEEAGEAIREEKLSELLNFYPVRAGDSFFIPSGTVHAIGAGCLIAEIQQSSDLTYRVYDYGRRDKHGNLRELHIEKAMRVASLDRYEMRELPDGLLGISKYFTARRVETVGKYSILRDTGSFKCLTVVSGAGMLEGTCVSAGDSYFIAAGTGEVILTGEMTIIISEVRKYRVETSGNTALLRDDLGKVIREASGETAEAARTELLRSLYMSEDDIEG